MRSEMLKLMVLYRQSLVDNLPELVDEVNQSEIDPITGQPYIAIVMPQPRPGSNAPVALGIRTDMLQRDSTELPAAGCGIYMRTVVEEGEQQFSEVVFPFTIDVYLGGTNADDLMVQRLKWGLVLDLWQERFGSQVLTGFTTSEAPDLDISYVLEERGDEFRQLVTATGLFTTHE